MSDADEAEALTFVSAAPRRKISAFPDVGVQSIPERPPSTCNTLRVVRSDKQLVWLLLMSLVYFHIFLFCALLEWIGQICRIFIIVKRIHTYINEITVIFSFVFPFFLFIIPNFFFFVLPLEYQKHFSLSLASSREEKRFKLEYLSTLKLQLTRFNFSGFFF